MQRNIFTTLSTGATFRQVAAKVLTGNGLGVREAHSLVAEGGETPSILWLGSVIGLSSFLKASDEDKVIPGNEESTGLSFEGHDQEKDGVPACMFAAEAVATHSQSDAQLNAFWRKTDRSFTLADVGC